MWSGRGSSSTELPAALGNQQPFSHGIGCSTGLGLVRRHKLPGLKHHGNTAPVGLSQESSWSCTDISGYRSESLTLDPSRPGVLCYRPDWPLPHVGLRVDSRCEPPSSFSSFLIVHTAR